MSSEQKEKPEKKSFLRVLWPFVRGIAGFGLAALLIYSMTRDATFCIGVKLKVKDGKVTVKSVYPGSPAEAEGEIKPGAEIVAAGNTAATLTKLSGSSSREVGVLINGEAGSELHLEVRDRPDALPRMVVLTRGEGLLSRIGSDVRSSSWPFLVLAFAFFGGVIALCFYRWRMLLAVQGVELSYPTVVRLGMIGLFFNLVIPAGAVSGDFVKMAYIAQHAADKKAEAIMTIMLDRVLGLFGLFIVAGAACLASMHLIGGMGGLLQGATAIIAVACVMSVCGLLAVQFREAFLKLPLVPWGINLGKRILPGKVVNILTRLVDAIDLYRDSKKTVFIAIGISVLVHCLNALTLYALGLALKLVGPSVGHYFLSIQVGNAIGAIPLTPSGFGTRDYIIREFLIAAGATPQKAVAVALLFTFVFSVWFLLGGPVFVFSRFHGDNKGVGSGEDN